MVHNGYLEALPYTVSWVLHLERTVLIMSLQPSLYSPRLQNNFIEKVKGNTILNALYKECPHPCVLQFLRGTET
jgi:hypothetical protein